MASSGVVYGQKARDLLMELKGAETLPAYNDEAVRAILAESAALNKEIEDLKEDLKELPNSDDYMAPLVVYAATLKRNKRCLYAYHARRCEIIDSMRWAQGAGGAGAAAAMGGAGGSSSSSSSSSDGAGAGGGAGGGAGSALLSANMSRAEADYYQGYSDALSAYILASGIDITADLQPPKDSYLEVVALRDCGRLMTLSGPRDVRAKEVHVIRRTDAEPLVRMGWLRHLGDKA